MWRRILSLCCAASTIAGCAFGTPTRSTLACRVDPQLLALSPPNLPPAQGGTLPQLLDNRIESKRAYKALWLKHRDVVAEIRNCTPEETDDEE